MAVVSFPPPKPVRTVIEDTAKLVTELEQHSSKIADAAYNNGTVRGLLIAFGCLLVFIGVRQLCLPYTTVCAS